MANLRLRQLERRKQSLTGLMRREMERATAQIVANNYVALQNAIQVARAEQTEVVDGGGKYDATTTYTVAWVKLDRELFTDPKCTPLELVDLDAAWDGNIGE